MPTDDFTLVDTSTIVTRYSFWAQDLCDLVLGRRETEQASRVHISINPLLLGDLKIFIPRTLTSSQVPGMTKQALKIGTYVRLPVATLKELYDQGVT